jgi:hypothetical protein
MSDEIVLFQRCEIVVTASRFMVGSKTYAVRNIVSTRGLEITPGCLNALFGARSKYVVSLTTAAGEVQAYKSNDKEFVGDLLEALDRAIMECGRS